MFTAIVFFLSFRTGNAGYWMLLGSAIDVAIGWKYLKLVPSGMNYWAKKIRGN